MDEGTVRKQFHWFSCEKKWAPGEMAYRLGQLEQSPDLAVLDGINAACSQHGWEHNDPSAIGYYRAMFVTPLAKAGAVILSLGHPPKARNRQREMHGFGSTAWLDEVDGVGFRMVPSKHPMVIGGKGWSELYVVKDRYSQVKRSGKVDATKDQPWYYMGAFIVDDSPDQDSTILRLNAPKSDGDRQAKSKEAVLADRIVASLKKRTGRFDSIGKLKAMLVGDEVTHTAAHLPIALELLVDQERLRWPEVAINRTARPGWLTSAESRSENPNE